MYPFSAVRRQLSSKSATFVSQFGALFASGIVIWATVKTSDDVNATTVAFLSLGVALFVLFLRRRLILVDVAIDGNFFIIKHHRDVTEELAVVDLESVEESIYFTNDITLHFKDGRRIRFTTDFRPFNFSSHPITTELNLYLSQIKKEDD